VHPFPWPDQAYTLYRRTTGLSPSFRQDVQESGSFQWATRGTHIIVLISPMFAPIVPGDNGFDQTKLPKLHRIVPLPQIDN
jgi:hypothetical protein